MTTNMIGDIAVTTALSKNNNKKTFHALILLG